MVHATERSERDFLTVDESGDVVKATWSSTPPANEKYLKNQQLLREIRKDQDQVRKKKKSKKPGHISAQEQEIHGIPDIETTTRGATQGLATGWEAESQPPGTRHHRPITNLGELTVDLSDVNPRKNKSLKPTLTKATERKNAEKVTKDPGNKPPNQSKTTTAKPEEGGANKRRESQTGKKTFEAKKIANQDLPKKQVKEKRLPPPVKFISASRADDDDEIQVIDPQNKQAPNLKLPGHKSAHQPQVTKNTNSTPSKPTEGHPKPPPNAPRGPIEKRKPKRPTDPPEVVVIADGDTNNEDQRTEKIKKAREITRKNLIGLHRLRSKQFAYSQGKKNKDKGGPEQDAYKMSERLTLHHDVVIMPEGHAGLVRDMTIPFKPKHGETKLTKEEKKRFMGMADRKHVCGHAYQLRLAQARQKLIKESVPKIKPSVLIKPKDGRRSYIRDDPQIN